MGRERPRARVLAEACDFSGTGRLHRFPLTLPERTLCSGAHLETTTRNLLPLPARHAWGERGHVGVMFRLWTSVLFITLSFVWIASGKSFTFYVATNGNDGWSGRLKNPARYGHDGPLATLPAALKAARISRQSSKQA